LIHAVEHPADTLSDAASAVEHVASDAWGTVDHAAEHRLHDVEDAGAALVHGIEHPTETLDAAASGLEKAAGEVADFGGRVVSGAASAGGEVLHALEHPGETLAAGESLAEGAARDLAGGAEHVARDLVGGVENAGGAMLDAIEHPGDTAAALAKDAEHVAGAALHGLESMGGGILHAIEHPLETLSSAEQAAEDFVTGFAAGVRDMAQAAMLLARVIPGTPMWMASMAIDPEGTVKLQEQFAKGLAHMVEHPVDALGNMIDIKDLQSGDYAKWLGHLTPDVIVTVLTAGGGGAAAAAGEGVARTAGEATAEQVAKTVAEDAAKTAGEGAAKAAVEGSAKASAETSAGQAAAETAGRAADDLSAKAGQAGGMAEAEVPPLEPLPGTPIPAPEDLGFDELLVRYRDELSVDDHTITQRELVFAGVTPKQVADALSGVAPLGTTPLQWAEMRADLTIALRESGLESADLGQAGSSIHFYAGRAKPFPQNPEEAGLQAEAYGHDPGEAAARYRDSPYGEGASSPPRHFFDSRYRLGIDARSDIDFSVSGRAVDERMAQFQAEHPEITDLISTKGGVYKVKYLELAFPRLSVFMSHWEAELGGREVNIVGKASVPP
jgi:hypothetical protein